MNDESISNEIDVLNPEWNRAWGQLRNAGYSDSEIWEMAASVKNASWPADPPPGKEKEHYYAELINYILDLRDRVLNEEQPPHVWIEAGIYASLTCSLAGNSDQAKDDFLRRQRVISRAPRKKTPSLARLVVEHVLDMAPPGRKTYPFFEKHIGFDRILVIDGVEIQVSTKSNEKSKVIKYGFEPPGVKKPEWRAQSSIRSIISRLNSQG